MFELLTAELASRVARAKAPHSADWALGRGFTPLAPHTFFTVRQSTLVRLLREQPGGWFDQPWPQVIAAALETVQHQLTARYGPSPAKWAWGQVRPLRFLHPAGERRPLGRVFNHGPLPGTGDSSAITQAYVNPLDPTAGAAFTPCLRMVIDVGNWQDARWALPGGQSGNPASPHYDDQLPRFQTSQGIPSPGPATTSTPRPSTHCTCKPLPPQTGPIASTGCGQRCWAGRPSVHGVWGRSC